MSYGHDFTISEKLLDNLSHKKYDCGGYATLVRHMVTLVGSCERHGFLEYYMSCALFMYMLQGHLMQWCATLPKKSIHSLVHLAEEIDHSFNHFDHEALDQEILKLRKPLDESVDKFCTCFCNIAYQFPQDEIDWEFLYGRAEYLLHISESCSTHFSDGVVPS